MQVEQLQHTINLVLWDFFPKLKIFLKVKISESREYLKKYNGTALQHIKNGILEVTWFHGTSTFVEVFNAEVIFYFLLQTFIWFQVTILINQFTQPKTKLLYQMEFKIILNFISNRSIWLTNGTQTSTTTRSSNFREGSPIRQTPEEGRRTYQPKHCGNNNKDEDNSLKTLNDKKKTTTLVIGNNSNKKMSPLSPELQKWFFAIACSLVSHTGHSFRDDSINEKLAGISVLTTKGTILKKINISFISTLVNTASILILFRTVNLKSTYNDLLFVMPIWSLNKSW